MHEKEKRQGRLWDWKAKVMKRSKKDGCWAQILEGLDWHAKTSNHCSVGTEVEIPFEQKLPACSHISTFVKVSRFIIS